MDQDRLVTPGEKLGDSANFSAGHGVFDDGRSLVATLVGHLKQDPREKGESKPKLRVLSVKHKNGGCPLPNVGSLLTAKVIKVTSRAATVEILLTDGTPLRELFKGSIRQQDVRQTEIDKVELYNCFVPGDVVLAEVISLGDRHSYFLSTAKNELGVIYAKSKAGVPMIAVNWQEMYCPTTNTREFRKVAKQ